LGFFWDHENRNTNLFNHRVIQAIKYKKPSSISINGKLKRYSPETYRCIPFKRNFILIKIIEYMINRLRFFGRNNPKILRETSEHLLLIIRDLCEKNNAKLLIACLEDSQKYYEFFTENGFSWCTTGVDRKEVDANGKAKWTLEPFDNHPNKKANKLFAKVLCEAIEKLIAGEKVIPEIDLGIYGSAGRRPDDFMYPHI
jgi:hypothetical protein